MMYVYGMRERPFDIGCQPKEGLIGAVDWETDEQRDKYWDVIAYDRPLTDDELEHYSLDFIERRG